MDFVNYYRGLALLPPVAEDPALTDGAQKHARYIILNNIVEPFELSIGRQGYTSEGAVAAELPRDHAIALRVVRVEVRPVLDRRDQAVHGEDRRREGQRSGGGRGS